MEKSISILPMFFLFAAIVVPAVASTHPPAQPEHIFLLAGQSNMVGHGGVRIGTDGRDHWDGYVPPRCQPDPKIFRLDRKLSWAEAVEPIHAGIFPNLKVTGIGPSMPFARHILELNANFGTLGLVPCAFDWTNMDEWSKNYTSRTLGSKPNLFRNLIGRANAAVRMGGEVAALFWWQGGKDASNYNDAIHYEEKLRNFFKDVRADLRRPDLPIIMIIIPKGKARYSTAVQQAQKNIELPNLIKVEPPKLPYEPDGVHVTSDGQVIVGTMVAERYCSAGHC